MTTTRELLLAERARARVQAAALDREFAGIADAAGEPGTDDEHDPEGATLAFERQHTAALLTRALKRIAEIDAAIGRLDDGTYGTCARCGQPIGEDRLAARPTAATCVRCARLPAQRSRAVLAAQSATRRHSSNTNSITSIQAHALWLVLGPRLSKRFETDGTRSGRPNERAKTLHWCETH